MPPNDQSATTAVFAPLRPTALAATDLGRWGILVVGLVLGGLFMAARAGDDYMFLCGMLFTGFGILLGIRLLLRWAP